MLHVCKIHPGCAAGQIKEKYTPAKQENGWILFVEYRTGYVELNLL